MTMPKEKKKTHTHHRSMETGVPHMLPVFYCGRVAPGFFASAVQAYTYCLGKQTDFLTRASTLFFQGTTGKHSKVVI